MKTNQFSGGLDSAVIAALADRIVPACEQVDLINVAFAKTAKVLSILNEFYNFETVDLTDFDISDQA